MEAAEEPPQESMLEDASPDSTAAEHDAMLDGEPARGDKSSSDSSSSEDGELPIVATGFAAVAAASAAAEASPVGEAGAARRPKKAGARRVAGGARKGGAWDDVEVAQVVELGRTLRGQGLGEAGFEGLGLHIFAYLRGRIDIVTAATIWRRPT